MAAGKEKVPSKHPGRAFKLKTALFRQTLLYSSRLKDGECGQMKDVWLRKRQYWVPLYLGAGWEAYDNCSTQGGSCRGPVPGQPPGCQPGERGWSLAGVRLPNLTSLHQTRTKWDFFQRLDKLGRFGQIWRKRLSVRWGQVSAMWSREWSCWDFSAEWLKGFLFYCRQKLYIQLASLFCRHLDHLDESPTKKKSLWDTNAEQKIAAKPNWSDLVQISMF